MNRPSRKETQLLNRDIDRPSAIFQTESADYNRIRAEFFAGKGADLFVGGQLEEIYAYFPQENLVEFARWILANVKPPKD